MSKTKNNKKTKQEDNDKSSKDNKEKKVTEEKENNSNEEKPEQKESSSWLSKKKNKIILIIGISSFCILVAVINIVLAVTGVRIFISDLFEDVSISIFKTQEQEENLPAIIPRKIDGVMVAREEANLVPACVMIENAAFGGVRPQSGLSQASLVYEVVVEGGITRLMAVFAGENSETVGPVRSARDTYLEFVSELNCAYYHAGGSFTAMQALQNFSLRDIDGLREYKYFYRDSNKIAPHNFYTSTEDIYQAIIDHSWDQQDLPSYTSWNFVDELISTPESNNSTTNAEGVTLEMEKAGSENVLNSKISILFGGSYNVEYNYDTETKVYTRKNGGVDHIDAVTGKVLTTNNVIIQHVGSGIPIEGKGRINWPVTGEGDVEIFRHGVRTVGTWKKLSRQGRTEFYDENGNLIELIRGNSWVEIVPDHISVELE